VGHAGEQHVLEIVEDGGERLRSVRRRRRQGGGDRAGLDLREHGQVANPLQVRGDPVERTLPVLPEGAQPLFLRLATSRQGRAFRTCSLVSQARRAWPIPSAA